MKKFLQLIIVFFISSCGFRPADSYLSNQNHIELLNKIELGEIKAPFKPIFTNHLYNELGQISYACSNCEYRLDLKVHIEEEELFIKKDSTVTRKLKSISCEYVITDKNLQKKLESSKIKIYTSTEESDSAYAAYYNQEETIKNALHEIARQLKINILAALINQENKQKKG